MTLSPVGNYWRSTTAVAPLALLQPRRTFRSDSALAALSKASDENLSHLLLYNFPSFSALFAQLFHSRLHLPLPFSSLHPFRPIGAVIFMQRRNLKMCLRSTDIATDTSEVAKAYGGGGTPSSSSFIIRMDEYNQWASGRSR